MNTEKKAVYIGRFQTLHNGHMGIMKYITEQPDVGELVVAVGSSQYSRFNQSIEAPLIINPFTFQEREAYVKAGLDAYIKKPSSICNLMDQHNLGRWAQYTVGKIKDIGVIYTNSKSEISAFEALGYETRRFPVKDQINATLIRELISNNGPWEQFVPPAVVDKMKELRLDKIIVDLFKAHPDEVEFIHKNRLRRGELTYDDFLKQIEAKQREPKVPEEQPLIQEQKKEVENDTTERIVL